MVPTMLKRLVVYGVSTVWMLGVVGCGVKQSEYDAKVTEAKSQAEKVLQLQKDLDGVKSEIDKAKQARKKDAEARTKALEQENASLKDRVKALEQENARLKANAEKDIAAVRGEIAKVGQARMTAEAKIKTLEQENADLRKKGPLDLFKKK